MRVLFSLFFVICLSSPAFAAVADSISIEGVVTNFSPSTVTLSLKGGGAETIKVPRGAIPSYYSIRSGHKVIAYVSKDFFHKNKKKQK